MLLLMKLIFSLHLAHCASPINLNKYNCLRNGACENECPQGFNGDTNCSSCTDDRLSMSSECTMCKNCNEDCLMGNFTLSVLFHSYLNRDSLCGECRLPEYGSGPICCDTINQIENCPSPCEFRFALSVQAYGESLQYIELPRRPPDFDSDNITTFPVGPDAFHTSDVSNPFTVQLNTWTGRFQIYIVVYDSYRVNNTLALGRFAIDRFPINVTLDGIPSNLSRRTYNGIYGIAQFDLSFEIQSDNHFITPCTISPITTPDIPSTATTAIDVKMGVFKGDDCMALMNSYRILQTLVIILPIIAVIATIIVITFFFYVIKCCRKYFNPKDNTNNSNYNMKCTSDEIQAEGLYSDCDANPSYNTVKSTTNISYGRVKSTINDGHNGEYDSDCYYS